MIQKKTFATDAVNVSRHVENFDWLSATHGTDACARAPDENEAHRPYRHSVQTLIHTAVKEMTYLRKRTTDFHSFYL